MVPDSIQARALKTWYNKNDSLHNEILHPLIGLSGESAELLNLYKKHTYQPGATVTRDDYIEELGGCLYYLSILAYQFGLALDDLSRLNRTKLKGSNYRREENQ